MDQDVRIVLTGFMGVGKSSVARHISNILKLKRVDLDHEIQRSSGRSIAQIIDSDGLMSYREIESANLENVLRDQDLRILSLGGGTWTLERNREMLREAGYTSVWLEASFEHCWLNIAFSRKDRPLARDKDHARQLFEQRQELYCLADWHFVIRSGLTSYDVARQAADEIFG